MELPKLHWGSQDMEEVLTATLPQFIVLTFASARESLLPVTASVPAWVTGLTWDKFRAMVIAPVLRVAIMACMVLLLMQMLEKLFLAVMVCLYVKVFRRKPEKVYNWEPLTLDEELGNAAFPMVLVQIPMYNEKEVYHLSIGAACRLSWPRSRLIVQVLDDSTDLIVKDLVQAECEKWANKGVRIKYEYRGNRKGYKAGALKEGMAHISVQECEYVAIFDADFQPEIDFLRRTIPFLMYNPRIALVQSRWKYVNATECLMTRMQEMSLNYHFKMEQEGGSSAFAFMSFNGTAGVWRISAINDAGGWYDRTTVEDMDLAVRACLEGWKFVYLDDVKVKSELPSTFKAYRLQQHRWSCGPANLFKKVAIEIIKGKKVSPLKKFYLICHFFLLGKIVSHALSFVYFCCLIPISVFVPEVDIPVWAVFYAPFLITICKAIVTPRSLHLVVLWVLFENVMSLHRVKGVMAGLLGSERVNEWVVTKKLGDAHKTKLLEGVSNETIITCVSPHRSSPTRKICQRLRMREIGVGVILMACGFYDALVTKKWYFIYSFLQGIAFLIAGFDYVGIHPPFPTEAP